MDPIIIDSIDPSCTFITPLTDENRCIGDDREVINENFENLNALLCNLELSASEHWAPMFSIMTQYSAGLIGAHDLVSGLSAFWDSAATTVQEMSSSWISPITIIYPEPFTPPTDIALITAWAAENFPIIEDDSVSCPRIKFPEGQRLWVVSLEYASSIRSIEDQAQGTSVCDLNDVSVNISVWGIRFRGKSTKSLVLTPDAPTQTSLVHDHVTVETTLVNYDLTSASNSVTFAGGVADQYVGFATGIELMVIGGNWVYTGPLPGVV